MQLTPPEKLILTMLTEIHKRLEITDSKAEFIEKAIDSNQLWALSLHDEETKLPKDVERVWMILEMWQYIETSYKNLSDDDKKHIKTETNLSEGYLTFHGFDGNHETKDYSIARFTIDELGKYVYFQTRKLDDTVQLAEYYNAMLAVYHPIKDKGSHLPAKTIITLVNASRKS